MSYQIAKHPLDGQSFGFVIAFSIWYYSIFWCVFIIFTVLGIEPRALHTLGKLFSMGLQSSLYLLYLVRRECIALL